MCRSSTSRYPTFTAKLRVDMRNEIRRIQQQTGITAIESHGVEASSVGHLAVNDDYEHVL